MTDEATLFVHIFTHLRHAYPFEVRDASDWMAKYFFTGGIMPSDSLLLYFQRDLRLLEHWQVSGRHYQLTSEAWLAKMDAHRAEIMPLMEATYGRGRRSAGGSTGGCSSCPARSSGVMPADANGSCRITCSVEGRPDDCWQSLLRPEGRTYDRVPP